MNTNYVWTSKEKWVLAGMLSFAIERFWTLIINLEKRPSYHSQRGALVGPIQNRVRNDTCVAWKNQTKEPPISKHSILHFSIRICVLPQKQGIYINVRICKLSPGDHCLPEWRFVFVFYSCCFCCFTTFFIEV